MTDLNPTLHSIIQMIASQAKRQAQLSSELAQLKEAHNARWSELREVEGSLRSLGNLLKEGTGCTIQEAIQKDLGGLKSLLEAPEPTNGAPSERPLAPSRIPG